MKNFLTICLLAIFPLLNAQEIKTIELLPPDSKEYSDLNFLKDELKGKQVVMLGEQTHMYGNICMIMTSLTSKKSTMNTMERKNNLH